MLEGRPDLIDHFLGLSGRVGSADRTRTFLRQVTAPAYDLLAELVERGFDEERAQSEAQRVVRVPDAGLPARGAGLQRQPEPQPPEPDQNHKETSPQTRPEPHGTHDSRLVDRSTRAVQFWFCELFILSLDQWARQNFLSF